MTKTKVDEAIEQVESMTAPALERLDRARQVIGTTLEKDKKGAFGMYTSLPAILAAIDKPLRDAGLMVVTQVYGGQLLTELVDRMTGHNVAGCTFDLPDDEPARVGAAISYFRRYALQCLIGFATDEDADNYRGEPAPPPFDMNNPMPDRALDTWLKQLAVLLAGGDKDAAGESWLAAVAQTALDDDVTEQAVLDNLNSSWPRVRANLLVYFDQEA